MKIDWKKLELSNTKYAFYDASYDYAEPCSCRAATRIKKQRVGWGKRAVEIRAFKTRFDRFEHDTIGLNDIMKKYRVVEAFDKVKQDVLVCGCGFLALAGDGDKVFPFTAEQATGIFDWKTQNLKEGVAVYNPETYKKPFNNGYVQTPKSYVEYTGTKMIVKEYEKDDVVTENKTGRPLIGLLTHNSTVKSPFGRSVLTRSARNSILDASIAMRQAMIAAYLYNTKVDVILGVDSDTSVEKIEAKTGDVLKVGTNENGQIPQIGEFAQHSMSPFNDTILTAARAFCSDTKLGLANLGISSDAPQSTEALEIINDDLRDDILAWQEEIGEQLKHFAITLWMYDTGAEKLDENVLAQINDIKPVFMPVFKTDISKFGDGLIKVAQEAPAIVEARSIWKNIGLSSEEIDMVIESAKEKAAETIQ